MSTHSVSSLTAARDGGLVPLVSGRMPTPLELRADISARLGVRFSLKREDTLDDVGSGHKLRKLNYVLGAALAERPTVLVTVGSLPSGQCVAVAAAARRHGLRSHLVYLGDRQVRPAELRGNYLLAAMLSDTITWFERVPWSEWHERLEQVAEAERARGERVCTIPPGITTWPGLLGSVELGAELVEQVEGDGEEIHVVAPAGTGATCLGIAIAAAGRPFHVHGVCIGGSRTAVERSIDDLRNEAAARLAQPRIRDARVSVCETAVGAGYDRPQEHELEEMRRVLRDHGLVLDPNYMLKTFLGTQQLIRAGTIPNDARVVLVHTGGSFGIFGDAPELRAWYSRLRDSAGAMLHAELEATS